MGWLFEFWRLGKNSRRSGTYGRVRHARGAIVGQIARTLILPSAVRGAGQDIEQVRAALEPPLQSEVNQIKATYNGVQAEAWW